MELVCLFVIILLLDIGVQVQLLLVQIFIEFFLIQYCA